ncbi:IS66 family transposase [Halosquirtibacter xylanolyticus]|uniref:IS66 family transposase n=1 Tax=Halosquirtibacter xylanolyticus TaxID=3374599 RepID=UPI00374925A3|nr:IS66 family transposase [Prolixibacteraceae bacterium]
MNKVDRLEKENKALKEQVQSLLAKLDIVMSEVRALSEENAMLHAKVKTLEDQLSRSKKNSGNSSFPPSRDLSTVKKNQSLRKKSNKRSGGQVGHKGMTLFQDTTPTDIESHHPLGKCSCGNRLNPEDAKLLCKRQVFDIPPVIEPICIEHRLYENRCSCGQIHKGAMPSNVNAPVQYGPNIRSLILSLHIEHYIPLNRISTLVEELTSYKIGDGTIDNILKHAEKVFTPLYESLRQSIEDANIVGSDETGCKIDGSKGWMWVWQNYELTFITAHRSRGYKVVVENFKDGFTNATLVSDCYASQLKTPAKHYQLCLAHLQRELIYIKEQTTNNWAQDILDLFTASMKLKRESEESDFPLDKNASFKTRLIELLKIETYDNQLDEIRTLRKRLMKKIDSVFTFLNHYEVPFDNNASERAMRNIKVKQNVSKGYRTEEGAQRYAMLRSITDTLKKQGKSVLNMIAYWLSCNNVAVSWE